MNGLPGIIGSGMPETYEMLRILRFVHKQVSKYNRPITFPVEFITLYTSLKDALAAYTSTTTDTSTVSDADFLYWDNTNYARETYRDSIVGTFTGETASITASDLTSTLSLFEAKVQQGIDRALATNNGLSPTYFYYECTDYEMLVPAATIPGFPPPPTQVKVKAFKLHTLPLFLEGPTRHFKVRAHVCV